MNDGYAHAAPGRTAPPEPETEHTMPKMKSVDLRSHRWFGQQTMRNFNHRSRMAQLGYTQSDYAGKPVIAILNTWSEINPCHSHFKQRVDEIKRGVLQAGGFPLELPAMSIAEPFQKPAGAYLMEDFYYAGGLPALLHRVRHLLHLPSSTINGHTLGENIGEAKIFNDDVILPIERALVTGGSLAVLRGNLAPDGAVIKPAAAEARLRRHRGPAVVFKNYDELAARIDDPDLVVDENSVLVLQNAGPQGGPGMPEWGQLPIPKKLLEKGVRDMVRISDARMSGTSFGACVLHVAPESFIGGPLAFVQDGDLIELDVDQRRLQLLVDDAELERRRAAWRPPPPKYARGYGALFSQQVSQANEGCDFNVLTGTQPVDEPDIY